MSTTNQAHEFVPVQADESHSVKVEDEPEVKAPTTFMVLSAEGSGLWREVGLVTANSKEAALRKTVDLNSGIPSVAVPVRSWKPVTPTVKTREVVSFQ